MSKKYFENFPNILYNGLSVKNITVRVAIYAEVLRQFHAFYPYTVEDDETPQYVAEFYYGSPQYDWLVFMSNKIIDPYFQWPLSNSDFHKFIVNKYDSTERALTEIRHYVYNGEVDVNGDDPSRQYDDARIITPTTYQFLSLNEKSFWSPVRHYEYEHNLNENRRNIKLLSSEHLDRIDEEMSKILRDE